MSQPEPAHPLQGVTNFRDVGKTVNCFLGRRLVREGVLFRSARPDDATPHDEAVLRDDLCLKTVIDLRSQTELRQQAAKTPPDAGTITSFIRSLIFAPQLRRIEGFDYHEIGVTGRSFERHLLSKLTWWSFFKVIFLAIIGLRLRASRIIVNEVMAPIGLLGVSTVSLDCSGAHVRDALMLLTSPRSLPILIHCTLGKDRTGLLCALALMALRVPIPAIEHDYSMSDAALVADIDKRLADLRETGFPEEWASTAKNMVPGVQAHLADKYGGIDGYLDSIGFGEDDRIKLSEALLY
ncbi:hypothetical protein CDD80_24 [Ophiocordyceps camponoti-rufipedis]|uniref:Tyrosine specific protein phosphatases domain-containing protein n=1 Tax=Ophiocordyceps camponoti-rufipedis TaxID=2004952 RepID=A0A2C5ZN08_9HYPO|nr:hypothetical protein CDD80_24 [Ophiocordyceps camponoti-rufipedis]